MYAGVASARQRKRDRGATADALRVRHAWVALLLCALVASGGCHLAVGISSCRHGEACPANERCDAELGVCRLNGNDPRFDHELDDDGNPDDDKERAPATLCGDGVAEGREHCDDGNRLSGDGCSSTCRVDDLVSEVEPNDYPNDSGSLTISTSSVFSAGINTLYYNEASGESFSEYDTFWLAPVEPVVVRVETFNREDADDCDGVTGFIVDMHREDVAQVWDEAFLRGSHDNGNGRCTVLTTTMAARPHLIRIREDTGTSFIPSYRAQITVLDDRGVETEPNDTIERAEHAAVDGLDATMLGAIGFAEDVDLYVVDVPPGRGLRAEVVPNAEATTCDAFNTRIALLDESGVEVLATASALNACAFVDGTGEVPRHEAAANTSLADRRLTVAVTKGSAGLAGTLPYRVAFTVR
ncbi:MAG: DUF4215 domain-containing protein [Deltaproteobacteria bacterium]|nr:DUF4215 domain-containing protein [Deltaproteobacteria bacterium]